MDLAFVIDGSGSIEQYGRGNFKRVLNFVRGIVRSFKIGRRFTRVGAVLFNTRAYKVFGFNSHYTSKGVETAIRNIRYPRGGTRTGYALRYSWEHLFRRNRRRRRKVLLLLTDGKSQDRVGYVSRMLRKAGIEIFAMGVGRKYNVRQLKIIATDSRHLFTTGFRAMKNIVRIIKRRICRGEVAFNLQFC